MIETTLSEFHKCRFRIAKVEHDLEVVGSYHGRRQFDCDLLFDRLCVSTVRHSLKVFTLVHQGGSMYRIGHKLGRFRRRIDNDFVFCSRRFISVTVLVGFD